VLRNNSLTTDSQQLKQFTKHEYNCSPRKVVTYILLLMLIMMHSHRLIDYVVYQKTLAIYYTSIYF